ncbi:MAG: WXG100 family type VII secretion target [Phycisphaerae bacterium]|jgi:uncharacterized protein YukE
MAKASVDPAELRRFAQGLMQFNNDLEGLMSGLNSRLRSLESSWRDQEQQKFAETFDQAAQYLGKFMESSTEHAKVLMKKAQHIEKYLNER